MDYQEKVCTADAIEDLYDRVIRMPHVRRYRGYDAVSSYCWDPHIETFIEVEGERWWDNPGYDPECEIPKEKKMTCMEKVREMRPEFQKFDTVHIVHEFCPNEFGLHGLNEDDPDRCKSINCVECWMREAVMLEAEDIPEEESVQETVEKLQKAGEALSLGYKEGISDEKLKAELKRGLDPEPAPEDVTKWPNNLSWPSPIPTSEEDKPRVLDSGHRRQFESGAVRDICEGKGRCDLLPLDVVAEYYDYCTKGCTERQIFIDIHHFQQNGNWRYLYGVLENCHIFSDVNSTLLLEVAKQFEDGAKKYGDSNWQKGIPVRCYIDSAVRHYLKYLRGDKDEPHDRAFCWNILCCIWTCIHKPELNDYAMKKEEMDG